SENEFLRAEMLERQLDHWQEHLSGGLPSFEWPCDRPRRSILTYRGSIVSGEWPSVVAEQLHEICREESVSLFMVLLAGFVLWWHQYTKKSDIIVGTLAPAGREQQEVQGLLGCFLNPVH